MTNAIQPSIGTRPQIVLTEALLIEGVHPATSGPVFEGMRREVQVNETLRFGLAVDTTRTWTLVRAPEDSKASLRAAQLTIDLPGLYIIRCMLSGGFHRDVEIVAFTERAFDVIGPKGMAGCDRRLVARSIINDHRATRETIAAALEHGVPGFGLKNGEIVGLTGGFSLKSFGGV